MFLFFIWRARQGAGYDLGDWEDRGDPRAAGEALINALRAQEDARAISRGAAGVSALCGPRFCLLPGLVWGSGPPKPSGGAGYMAMYPNSGSRKEGGGD